MDQPVDLGVINPKNPEMTDARAARAEEVCFQSRSSLTLAASHTWCGGGGGGCGLVVVSHARTLPLSLSFPFFVPLFFRSFVILPIL